MWHEATDQTTHKATNRGSNWYSNKADHGPNDGLADHKSNSVPI